jgi:hypothetical protein
MLGMMGTSGAVRSLGLGAKIANNLDHLRPQEETMVELIDAADALLSLKYVKND